MSNITHGMDVDEVDDLGNTLISQATRLRSLASETNGRVSRAQWHGPDGTYFTTRAWPAHRSTMHVVADQIEELGRKAKENAAAQRLTSDQLAGGGIRWEGIILPPDPGGFFNPVPWGPFPGAFDGWIPIFGGAYDFFENGITGGVSDSWQSGLSGEASGSGQIGDASVSGEAGYLLGARANASADGGITRDRIFGSAEVGGFVGAEATAAGTLAVGGLALAGSAYAFGGASGTARARGSLSADGLEAGVQAEAFAGVKAGADVSGEFAGVEAGANGEVWAGVGAEFNADITATLDEVAFELDAGAALGLGFSVGVDVSFSPSETAADVADFFNPFD